MRLSKNTKTLFLLWFITLFSCAVIFKKFLLGNEFVIFKDVGSDTWQQYIMQYHSIVHAIKSGTLSLWDFNNGFGTSIYALNLFHPLLFLLYLTGVAIGPENIAYLLVFFTIGQIVLAVTVFYFYLNEFSYSCKVRLIAAYLYGFSGYLMVWGQHYQFGLYVILLPLLLLLIEKALKKRRFSFLLTLTVSVAVLGSVYMSYMTLLMAGLYLFIRLFFMDITSKDRVRLLLQNGAAFLLGIGMAMVVFLPNAYYLLNTSSRLDTSGSVLSRLLDNLKPFSGRYYFSAFYRLFSANLCGISDNYIGVINYYEAPMLFLSVLFVILMLQYIFTIHRQEASVKVKILQYISLLLVGFFCFIPAGTMVFNAFSSPFFRHYFVFIPLCGLVIAFTLEQILYRKQISYAAFAVTAAAFAFLYYKNPGTRQASTPFICLLGFLMMGVLLLCVQKKKNLSPVLISGLLLSLVMTNVIYDSYHDYNNRITLTKDDHIYSEQLYGNNITAAIDYLRQIDTSFYRIEKDYEAGSYCLDAMAQNYNGVSTYNSAANKDLQAFVQRLWPNLVRITDAMESYRQTVYDVEMASLFNIKYLLSHNPQLDAVGFTHFKQFGDVYIYRNERSDSIGKFYTSTIHEGDIPKNLSQVDIDLLLSRHLIIAGDTKTGISLKKEFPLKQLDYTLPDSSFSDAPSIEIPLDRQHLNDYERLFVSFDITTEDSVQLYIQLNDSSRYYQLNTTGKKMSSRLRLPENCTALKIVFVDTHASGNLKNIKFYGSKQKIDFTPAAQVSFAAPEKENFVTGSVVADTPGTLMVSIPYEAGWHAYVNDAEVPILRANLGFIGLELPAGNHTVSFRYTPPGLIPGISLSILGVILFITCLTIRRVRMAGGHRAEGHASLLR